MARKRMTDRAAPAADELVAAPTAPAAAGGGFPGTNTHESEAGVGAAGVPVAPRRGYIGDTHWGKGGRYIVGKDGVRRPAENKE